MDVADGKCDELKLCLSDAFPEIFSEGAIDFDQLKRVLGKWVEPGKERFGLTWPGKAECMRIIQQHSVATLKPVRSESVNFDETRNVFIEGDNLEVLKLLQKSYFSKARLIFIDPPYNTGAQFIYPDKYAETLATYLAYTGQVSSEGKKFSTNVDTAGRFHTRWLNMMYPRLYLARNLLKENGTRSGPVVDLRFLSSSGLDDSDRFRGSHSPEFANETLDRFVAAGKTVIRDQVLPDRHRVAATLQRLLDRLPVRLAGTARRWAWRGSRRLCRDRILGLRVGGHFVGRF